MQTWKFTAALFLAMSSTAVLAQDRGAVTFVEVTELPTEVEAVLQSRNPVQILSIDGTERVSGPVLYVDELIVQRDSRIVFDDLDQPYLALVAQRVRVVDAEAPFEIGRIAQWKDLDGDDGPEGSAGAQGGRQGRHGTAGGNGTAGGDGTAGEEFDLPIVYVIIGELEDARSGADLASWNITYSFDGIPGGDGGSGGRGGPGGRGGKGKKWKPGGLGVGCGAGPGRGGNGGNGGRGGNGAMAGDGGNGAPIAFVATRSVVDALTLGDINNYGAEPGRAGEAGRGGAPGSGGNAGSSGNCSEESDGRAGQAGSNGQAGADNDNLGERGPVSAYIVPSAQVIFD